MASDRIDDLLDSALAAYGSAEPRDGLEDRVLASIRAERARKVLGWTMASFATALLTVVVVLRPQPVEKLRLPEPPKVGAFVIPPSPAVRLERVAHRRKRLPKLDRFPRSSPLTEQERLLLVLARCPEVANSLLADSNRSEIEPIRIAALYPDESKKTE